MKVRSILSRIHPVWLVIYLLLMVLLVNLGFWQLGRESEKREFIQQQQEGMEAIPVRVSSLEELDAIPRYQFVELNGSFDSDHQFLLDNQLWEGRPGYQVFTPFKLANSPGVILVNRGWVPMEGERSSLPEVGVSNNLRLIKGRRNEFMRLGVILKGVEFPEPGWPSRVQMIVSDKISEHLGYGVAAFPLELAEDQSDGYARHWTIQTTIPPEKHRAYAVQWFGLAITLTLLFLWQLLKKNRE